MPRVVQQSRHPQCKAQALPRTSLSWGLLLTTLCVPKAPGATLAREGMVKSRWLLLFMFVVTPYYGLHCVPPQNHRSKP